MPRRVVWLALGLVAASTLLLVVAGSLGRWAELTGLALRLVLTLLGMLAFLLAQGRDFPRPKSFQGTQEVQVAPTSPAFNAILVGQILMTGALLWFLVTAWQTDSGFLAWAATIMTVLIGLLIVGNIVSMLRGIPRLEFTSQALVLRHPLGVRRIPWQALSQVAPVRHVNAKRLSLNVTDRKLIQRHGFSLRSGEVDLSYVAVDSQFLAESIYARVVQAQSPQMS